MNLEALRKELAAGTIRSAYLLAGEEPLLRDDALDAIRATVLGGEADDFNFERLEGARTAPAALRNALQTLPVFADRRLVVLRDPEPTRGSGKELAAALPELVERLASQSEAVLVVAAVKVDKRSKWVKCFKDPAALVECDPPRAGKAVVSFVRQEAKRQKVKLQDGVAELLAERIGPQLLLLRQEIAKAALLAGPGEEVACSHAETLITQVAEDPVWDLTDAIGEGRREVALETLARMLRSGSPPVLLLGALASHFRKLARARGGAPVPGPPFAVRKLEHQARRFTSARLLACLERIHETDLALKGAGGLPAELALEQLVLGLAS